MEQTTVAIPSFIDVVDVLGAKDRHIKIIHDKLGTKITENDKMLYLFGDEPGLSKSKCVVEHIIEVLETGEKVVPDDVDLFVRQAVAGERLSVSDDDVILSVGRKTVKAKTKHQREYVDAIRNHSITFAVGVAGSAKSYCAVTSAIAALKAGEVKHIVITRPPIAIADMDIGYIPGDANEKMAPFLSPIINIFLEFYSKERVEDMLDKGVLQIVPLAYIRGWSIKDSFVICDECQNLTTPIFQSILTRLGVGSKIVLCGDTKQSDLGRRSGLEETISIVSQSKSVAVVRMTEEDIVRSGVVAEMIHLFGAAGY